MAGGGVAVDLEVGVAVAIGVLQSNLLISLVVVDLEEVVVV